MYEAKRITTETGTARSAFPLRVAALDVPLSLAALALPLAAEEAGVGTLRVELMTAEVVGIESFDAPSWTSKYMP
jgi:hypothetical protein